MRTLVGGRKACSVSMTNALSRDRGHCKVVIAGVVRGVRRQVRPAIRGATGGTYRASGRSSRGPVGCCSTGSLREADAACGIPVVERVPEPWTSTSRWDCISQVRRLICKAESGPAVCERCLILGSQENRGSPEAASRWAVGGKTLVAAGNAVNDQRWSAGTEPPRSIQRRGTRHPVRKDGKGGTGWVRCYTARWAAWIHGEPRPQAAG